MNKRYNSEILRKRTEADEQMATIQYLRIKHPNILLTIAPEGMKLPLSVAVKMKRMGYVKGTPDLMIFEPVGKYHGLFIEMKKKGGKVTQHQKDFLKRAERRGYKSVICYGSVETCNVIDNYLEGKDL